MIEQHNPLLRVDANDGVHGRFNNCFELFGAAVDRFRFGLWLWLSDRPDAKLREVCLNIRLNSRRHLPQESVIKSRHIGQKITQVQGKQVLVEDFADYLLDDSPLLNHHAELVLFLLSRLAAVRGSLQRRCSAGIQNISQFYQSVSQSFDTLAVVQR